MLHWNTKLAPKYVQNVHPIVQKLNDYYNLPKLLGLCCDWGHENESPKHLSPKSMQWAWFMGVAYHRCRERLHPVHRPLVKGDLFLLRQKKDCMTSHLWEIGYAINNNYCILILIIIRVWPRLFCKKGGPAKEAGPEYKSQTNCAHFLCD